MFTLVVLVIGLPSGLTHGRTSYSRNGSRRAIGSVRRRTNQIQQEVRIKGELRTANTQHQTALRRGNQDVIRHTKERVDRLNKELRGLRPTVIVDKTGPIPVVRRIPGYYPGLQPQQPTRPESAIM